ncbi:MAG: tetratricopeptide repeat protein [Chloroflexi bacterium]|nr:tetratricopeptide repeat protein [Chloroflexota bacterium]
MKTYLRFLWMTLAALSLAACTLGAAEDVPVTYVVITNTAPADASNSSAPITSVPPPTVASAAQLQPTVPPTPAATPITDPSAALAAADRDAHDGFYDRARQRYSALFTVAPEASAGYAKIALREGDFGGALTALNSWLTLNPDDPRSADSYFLRGEANLGVGRWTTAINDYRQFLRLRPGVIDSYVHERIGDAFFALDMTSDALASYDAAVAALRARVPLAALRERAAQIYRAAGQPAQAVASYDAILADAQNHAYRAFIEREAGDALRASGDVAGATVRYQRIVDTYTDVPAHAGPALAALIENGVSVNAYTRGKVYYYAENYAAAIEAFNEYTTSVTLDQIPAELHLFLGRAYRAAGNSAAARVAFRTIVEQYPTNALFGDAVLELGRTDFLAGDIPEAIRQYLSIAETYPNLAETAAEALWRAGFLHNEAAQFAEAQDVFVRLAERYPDSAQAVSGLGIAAAAARANGDTGSAEQLYRQLANVSTKATRAEALYQVGQLAEARNAPDVARDAFAQAVAADSDSYFAARARDALDGRPMFDPPANVQLVTATDPASIAEAGAWLMAQPSVPPETVVGELPQTVANDPRWTRGQALWDLGLFEAAEAEILDLLEAMKDDLATSYALALALSEMGVYYPSQQAAANLIAAAGVGTLDVPPSIARLRFPVPYADLVVQQATEREFNPLLLFALIRHESLFDTTATAAAGEKGLTQVIPGTGDYIAGLLAWPDYEHSDLFQPQAGIAFGAAYLDEQLDRFGQDAVAALAGYNAGPGRAIAWREAAGPGDDAFINAIAIGSTRLYVQRIYTFFTIYRALYGA